MYFTFGNCVNALAEPTFSDPLILAMDARLRMLPLFEEFSADSYHHLRRATKYGYACFP